MAGDRSGEMTFQEALDVLDIESDNPDEDEIRSSYENLVTSRHPDQGGSKDELIELRSAYDRALQEDFSHSQLPAKRTSEELVEKIAEEVSSKGTEEVVNRTKKRSTSKLRRQRKKYTYLITPLSAILAVLGATNFNLVVELLSYSNSIYSVMVLIPSFYIILPLAYLHFSIKNIKEVVDLANTELDWNNIKSILLDLDMDEKETFTNRELEGSISDWCGGERGEGMTTIFLPRLRNLTLPPRDDYKRMARIIGPKEFSDLFLQRGTEEGIFSEAYVEENGEKKKKYKVNL